MDRYGNLIRNTASVVDDFIPHIQSSSRRYNYRNSWWGNFNYGIASIGEWIQKRADGISLILTVILTLIPVFMLLKWNFNVFCNDGLFLGLLSLLADFVVVGIGYYAFLIVFGILLALFSIIGYVFYNAYTLIVAIVLTCGLLVYDRFSDKWFNNVEKTEVTTPAYTVYYCTASRLNVRSAPNSKANVIGTIPRGSEIHVYGFEGDFAKIEWKNNMAYVSRKYIKQ